MASTHPAAAYSSFWKRSWVRWVGLGLGILFTIALALLGWAIWVSKFSPQGRHQGFITRINGHAWDAKVAVGLKNTLPSTLTGDARTRAEAMMAVSCTLGNPMWRHEDCDDVHLRAIADRLDRTGGEELKTGAGCLRLIEELIEVCPKARDYIWIENLREMQAQGVVAKLPPKK